MKTITKLALSVALMVVGVTGCKSDPPSGETADCGSCPTGTSCNPATNKCESICAQDSDCGKCSTCDNNFCNKYADFCVISVEPANGATGVPISTQEFKIIFSDDVASSAVQENRFSLIRGEDGPVSLKSLDSAGAVVTMKTGTQLISGTEYTIKIAKEVMSVGNMYLPEIYYSKFTSAGSEEGAAGPAGYGLSPVAGQMKGGKYTLDIVGGPVAGTAENGNKSVTVSDGFWK